MRFWSAVLACCAILGCGDAELFQSCPFDRTIQENCRAEDGGAEFTCVVERHPQCPEEVCLSWRSSAPFCTRSCTPGAGDCPSGSACEDYDATAGKYFCVPDSVRIR